MPTPDTAAEHYRRQQRLAATLARQARGLWAQMSPVDFDGSWARVGPRLRALLVSGQLAAARDGGAYVASVLAELGIQAAPDGAIVPAAFAGVASSGFDLEGVLYEPVIRAKAIVGETGVTGRYALTEARKLLDGIILTQIADAARTAAGVSVAARPRVGYVRMLNPPSCSRCVVLAGKFYRWNEGFLRHPRCDCRHIPTTENLAGDVRTDPDAYFRSLGKAEQDRTFTSAGAQAMRDGADMSQVVNARRGAAGMSSAGGRGRLQAANVHGRNLITTTEGVTVRGVAGKRLAERGTTPGRDSGGRKLARASAPRLMPESIYEIAGDDRAEAVRLLRLNGYIA